MDLMAELRAYNTTPDKVRARAARRSLRADLIYDRIGQALNKPSAFAKDASGWNMLPSEDIVEGAPIGGQHPGAAALLVVRQALSQFALPSEVELRFSRLRRASGHGAFAMDEGLVMIEATLHSLSGPSHHVDIPVLVREGRLLAPSVFLDRGEPRVLTQSALDDIIGRGEFKAQVPDRKSMFAPGPDKRSSGQPRREVPLLRPGMFKVPPNKTLIASAVRGFTVAAQTPDVAYVQPIENELLKQYIEMAAESSGCERGTEVQVTPEVQQAAANFSQMVSNVINYWLAGKGQPYAQALEPEFASAAHYTWMSMQGEGTGIWDAWSHVVPKDALQALNAAMKKHPGLQRASSALESAIQNAVPDCGYDDDGGEDPGDDEGGGGEHPAPPDFRRQVTPTERPRMQADRRRSFYGPDVTPFAEPGSRGPDIPGGNGSDLDPAERPLNPKHFPGAIVKLKAQTYAHDRGGGRYTIPKGARGVILRDVDGAGRAFIVRFGELGFSTTVSAEALSGA